MTVQRVQKWQWARFHYRLKQKLRVGPQMTLAQETELVHPPEPELEPPASQTAPTLSSCLRQDQLYPR